MTEPSTPNVNEANDNVVPENEMARRRVTELATDMADLFKDMGERMVELREMSVPTPDWVEVMARSFSDELRESLGEATTTALPLLFDLVTDWIMNGELPAYATEKAFPIGVGLGNTLFKTVTFDKVIDLIKVALPLVFGGGSEPDPKTLLTPESFRMRNVIRRLFDEAPKMEDASGKSATQSPALECHVSLKGGFTMHGALSTTPEGTLRCLAPNQQQTANGPKLVMIEHFFDIDQVADIALIREVEGITTS